MEGIAESPGRLCLDDPTTPAVSEGNWGSDSDCSRSEDAAAAASLPIPNPEGNWGSDSDWSRSVREGMSPGPRERDPKERESFSRNAVQRISHQGGRKGLYALAT